MADGAVLDSAAVRSFRGRRWQLPASDKSAVAAMMAAGVPAAVAPVLAARGMSAAEAKAYVEPTLRGLLPNPSFFKDMTPAVERLVAAIKGGETIAIWGDYDVDGATSSAILTRFLRWTGVEPIIYIPDRMREGYGPNAAGLKALREHGASVVVIVDSGTTAFEPLKAARDIGLDAIVIDHHAAEETLPPAVALINPNRLDQTAGYGYVCTAGLAFIVCVGLNAVLRDTGFLAARNVKPDLFSLLDLVALGTVADVVPLVGINRAFVRRGLEVMSERKNPGIAALCDIASLDGRLRAYDCGFVLGPRINAGGRVGQADTGARLLSSDDPILCMDLAQKLDAWNKERKDLEKACSQEAIAQVEADKDRHWIAMAAGEGWHEGVVGIVAARVKEAFDAPSFVFSINGDIAKGSGRSVKGFDLGRAVIAARRDGILMKGGGHPMAAGVTLKTADLPRFKAYLDAEIAKSSFAQTGVIADIDMVLPADRVSVGLADELLHMEPFGQSNPQPRFMLPACRVADVTLLKDVHMRVEIEGPNGRRLKAMLFHAAGTKLGEALRGCHGQRIDLLGTIKADEWQGVRRAQLMIEDARAAVPPAQAA